MKYYTTNTNIIIGYLKKIKSHCIILGLFFGVGNLCGCGITAKLLPQPSVENPNLAYQGEIIEITDPIEIKLSPLENISLQYKFEQTRDDQQFKATHAHRARGSIKRVENNQLRMYLDFHEATYDGNKLADNYKIKGEFTLRDSGEIKYQNVYTKRTGKTKNAWGGNNLDKTLDHIISNWMPYILRLPVGSFQTGTPISWSRIFTMTGREYIPMLKTVSNNSVVSGITDYNGREHIVLSFDVLCERKGDTFYGEGAILPVSCHLSGYILVDKATGIHSFGNLKSRVAIQGYTGIDYYWISNQFSVLSN